MYARCIALYLVIVATVCCAGDSSSNPQAGSQPSLGPSYLLLVCRENQGKPVVLSSQLVAGELKREYTDVPTRQIAELVTADRKLLTRAFYEVEREIRWTDVRDGTDELFGGTIPSPEIVFSVRVPFSRDAEMVRLLMVKDNAKAEALIQGKLSASDLNPADVEVLLEMPLRDLPGVTP